MTDKQIIIDGVDVSGCNRLNTFPMQYGEPHEICLTSLEQWGGQEKYCKDRPNCYYKQLEKLKAENLGFKILHESDKNLLKRKEQECEELKEKCKKYGEINEQETKDYAELKAENEELKEKLTILDDEDVVVEITVRQFEEYKKLKQTLAEIKEIANYSFNLSTSELLAKLEQILQKISEVENVANN